MGSLSDRGNALGNHPRDKVSALETAIQRIQAGYGEMPGLKLTPAQARLVFGLDCPTCERALRVLVDARFLACTPEGRYVRFDAGA